MVFKELDVVCLKEDDKVLNVKRHDLGTIIHIFSSPNLAYEVEFVDKRGVTLAQKVCLPSDIELIKRQFI